MQNGLLKESDVDKAISNNFATLMRLGFFDGEPSKRLYGSLSAKDVCSPEHQALALDAARQGIVLLKNSAGILPLSSVNIKSLVVIGPNANVTKTMIGNYEGIRRPFPNELNELSIPDNQILIVENLIFRQDVRHLKPKINQTLILDCNKSCLTNVNCAFLTSLLPK